VTLRDYAKNLWALSLRDSGLGGVSLTIDKRERAQEEIKKKESVPRNELKGKMDSLSSCGPGKANVKIECFSAGRYYDHLDRAKRTVGDISGHGSEELGVNSESFKRRSKVRRSETIRGRLIMLGRSGQRLHGKRRKGANDTGLHTI
jgi:hypothetical protein